jgi:hypothetical protein
VKRFIIILALFSYLFPQDGKLAVSILDFTGEDVSDKLLRACYQKLETSLIESNRFTVIAKNQREQILEEMKFQSSGVCDEECAVEIGKLVGAEYLMLGDIIGFADLYQVNIKIVNIEKGDIVEKVTKEIQGNLSDLLNGMAESSREITRRIVSGEEQVVTQQPGMAISQKKYGDIIIESNPPGATIFVDDDEKGFTPQELTGIEVGTRRLMLVKPGYETLNKGVIVSEDAPISVSEVLIPKMGSLTVLSEPIGATVFLNDVPKGKTPLDIPSLNIGDYVVIVSLENYQDVTQRITVEYNENTNRNIDLKPLPGKINIIVSPSSTYVSLNGKKIKTNPSGITSVALAAGTHRINFSLYGYEPVEKVVTIKANESTSLEVNMKKLPAGFSSNTNMGFLTVHAYNDNVKLKIAGVNDIQSLPLKYYELKYGSYTLKAFKKGFESKMLNADIERQKTTRIEVNLDKKLSGKALKYSMLFPGGGQFYSDNKAKGVFFSATTVGLAAMLGNTFTIYQDENSLVDNYQQDYQNAVSQSDIDTNFGIYENQVNSVNDLQNQLIIYGSSLAATYLINVIDAKFFSGL